MSVEELWKDTEKGDDDLSSLIKRGYQNSLQKTPS